ncbi:MAG: hypothetical protein V1663_01020 [archaeon]
MGELDYFNYKASEHKLYKIQEKKVTIKGVDYPTYSITIPIKILDKNPELKNCEFNIFISGTGIFIGSEAKVTKPNIEDKYW